MGWRQPGATVWLSCPTRRQISRLPIPPFPPPPFFCLVACTRPHVPPCPSVGWLVRRAAFFVPFRSVLGHFGVCLGHVGSFWVNLGHFGSVWVTLGRIGHLGLARDSWALALFFWGNPNFFGVPPCYFNVDLACLCTCMFLV